MSALSDLFALIIAGLASGSAYALLALGIVIIYRSTHAVNFAIGSTGVLAVYLSLFIIPLGIPLILVLLFAVVSGGLFGIATERLLIRPLGDRKNFAFIGLVITIGLGLLIHATIGVIWGHANVRFPPLVEGVVRIGSFAVTWNKLVSGLFAIAAMALVAFFFGKTALGAAMRASAEDQFAARLVGIKSSRIAMLSWFIGCALSALGMFFLAAELPLNASLADYPLFRAFAGVFLGGLTSMPGAVLGGFLIGVLDNIAGAYVSANFRDTIVFAIILLVLFLRPAGIFGVLKADRV
jgi:branched-chain amino acid transport system permease protein